MQSLNLSDVELKELIEIAFNSNNTSSNNNCKAVVCKVPYNYDVTKYNQEDYQTFSLSKKVKLLIFHQFTKEEKNKKRKLNDMDDGTKNNNQDNIQQHKNTINNTDQMKKQNDKKKRKKSEEAETGKKGRMRDEMKREWGRKARRGERGSEG